MAREQFLKGEYDEAARLYEELGRSPDHQVRAACGRSAVDLAIGGYREGLERLMAVKDRGDQSADWHACVASMLAAVGEYDQAIAHNRRAIVLEEEHLRALWQLGQILETVGRTKEAIQTYGLFDEMMAGPEPPADAEQLTYLGRGFYRYSVLTGHTNLVQRTKHVLRQIYQEAFDLVDSQYWPARLAAAELLLDKHQINESKSDFQRILEQNPKAAGAMVGLGRAALEDWEFEEVETRAKAALAVNPNDVAAMVLLAEERLTERRLEEAAALADKALATNPNSVEALGVLAAAKWRLGDTKTSVAIQRRAEKINPRPAVFHHAMGRWLSAARQYADAEQHFKKAIAFAPCWPEPRTALGQLYMETGEESLARPTLEKSFALDSFNHHTNNVLELLDSLDGFARLESEHFVLKYDAKEDAVAAPYFSETLEKLYPEVCDDFAFEPGQRTIIELFPDHMGLSVRVAGRPFIGTIGACTGRVIAMAAPRGRPPFGRFNWASVLRHEFTHTVTLAATNNHIPHWMTEGLAVYEEPSPRSWGGKHMLSDTVRRDRLFTLESISWGFMRPLRPNDRNLAYAQSEWMVEYIVERYRYRAILDLLSAFRDGSTQAQAFQRVLKLEPQRFDEEFETWAKAQVKQWGLPNQIVEDPKDIRKQLGDKPDDAALLGRLAQAELLDGEADKAEVAALRALAIDKDQPRALEVMAHVIVSRMLAEKDQTKRRTLVDDIEPYARRLHKIEPENPAAIKYLGYVEQAWQQWNEAIAWYEQYQRRFPEDPDTFRRLAGIYLARKDHDEALKQLESLARLAEDEPAVAKQIASIHADRKAWSRAVHWYGRALEIDPYDVDTHGALADALLASGKFDQSEREYRAVCTLRPDEAIGYEGLARVYSAMGNSAEAETYRKKAEARGGDLPRGPGKGGAGVN
jgi:tetratricopeptide (TPR) repeat protein